MVRHRHVAALVSALLALAGVSAFPSSIWSPFQLGNEEPISSTSPPLEVRGIYGISTEKAAHEKEGSSWWWPSSTEQPATTQTPPTTEQPLMGSWPLYAGETTSPKEVSNIAPPVTAASPTAKPATSATAGTPKAPAAKSTESSTERAIPLATRKPEVPPTWYSPSVSTTSRYDTTSSGPTTDSFNIYDKSNHKNSTQEIPGKKNSSTLPSKKEESSEEHDTSEEDMKDNKSHEEPSKATHTASREIEPNSPELSEKIVPSLNSLSVEEKDSDIHSKKNDSGSDDKPAAPVPNSEELNKSTEERNLPDAMMTEENATTVKDAPKAAASPRTSVDVDSLEDGADIGHEEVPDEDHDSSDVHIPPSIDEHIPKAEDEDFENEKTIGNKESSGSHEYVEKPVGEAAEEAPELDSVPENKELSTDDVFNSNNSNSTKPANEEESGSEHEAVSKDDDLYPATVTVDNKNIPIDDIQQTVYPTDEIEDSEDSSPSVDDQLEDENKQPPSIVPEDEEPKDIWHNDKPDEGKKFDEPYPPSGPSENKYFLLDDHDSEKNNDIQKNEENPENEHSLENKYPEEPNDTGSKGLSGDDESTDEQHSTLPLENKNSEEGSEPEKNELPMGDGNENEAVPPSTMPLNEDFKENLSLKEEAPSEGKDSEPPKVNTPSPTDNSNPPPKPTGRGRSAAPGNPQNGPIRSPTLYETTHPSFNPMNTAGLHGFLPSGPHSVEDVVIHENAHDNHSPFTQRSALPENPTGIEETHVNPGMPGSHIAPSHATPASHGLSPEPSGHGHHVEQSAHPNGVHSKHHGHHVEPSAHPNGVHSKHHGHHVGHPVHKHHSPHKPSGGHHYIQPADDTQSPEGVHTAPTNSYQPPVDHGAFVNQNQYIVPAAPHHHPRFANTHHPQPTFIPYAGTPEEVRNMPSFPPSGPQEFMYQLPE